MYFHIMVHNLLFMLRVIAIVGTATVLVRGKQREEMYACNSKRAKKLIWGNEKQLVIYNQIWSTKPTTFIVVVYISVHIIIFNRYNIIYVHE